MRNAIQLTITAVLILIACIAFIVPPDKNLRLGKDLAGGTSLVYSLQIDEQAPPDVIEQTIEVLKDRVDPNGQFDISMVQTGRNRLEITMPLPSDAVKELRDEFDEALEAMAEFELDVDAFERAMRLEGPARTAALERLAESSDGIASLLEPVIQASRQAVLARANANVQTVPAPDDTADVLAAAAEAEIALEDARRAALARVVTRDQIRIALTESTATSRVPQPDRAAEPLVIPSDRERALASIRARIDAYEGGAAAFDNVLEAFEEYADVRRGFDDPTELQRLLQSTGVLQFRIAVRSGSPEAAEALASFEERGPDASDLEGVRWFRINNPVDWFDDTSEMAEFDADATLYFAGRYGLVGARRDGLTYLLLYDQPGLRLTERDGDWGLESATPSTDEFGRPAIAFRMDPRGARLLSQLTADNVGQPMAILLDGRVYQAPNINERLSTSVQISGEFSNAEINYMVKTLNAGSVQAQLSERPISINTLAPELGADNLKKGLDASYIALILVGVFMIVYYFSSGGIALFSMLCSAIIILGAMAAARAAFTLPGIAGIVLTFGMAVDANVLIYERIREELNAGMDLRIAVKTAYKKVLSTIVDANITNLIVCVVLAQTATQEIRGFAITLGVGVLATMFSSLVITRLVFHYLIDVAKVKSMSQLPIKVPAIDRLLTPNINWIKLRPAFITLSAIVVGLGVVMIFIQRGEMLDTEFRGGTAVTVQLKQQDDGGRVTLTRAEVQQRIEQQVDELSEAVDAGTAEPEQAQLLETIASLTQPSTTIIPIDPQADGVTSSRFQIKTSITEDDAVQSVITRALSDVIDAQPALTFLGSTATDLATAPVYQIFEPNLGDAIERPDIRNDVGEYVGGAAIVIDDIEPAISREAFLSRLEFMRTRADFAEVAADRRFDIITLEGDDDAITSAVLVVVDRNVDIYNEEVWRTRLAEVEWNIVRAGLAEATTLASKESFSPAIAATFRAQATVAVLLSLLLILIYIRIRFGSLRYSLAAIVALLHDVIAVIGLIAFAEILYKVFPAVAAIGIQPFKIDLGLVAALLTIIGYSLNDTIIILDRIRENRGRLPYASEEVVNRSINQTLSRTIITSGTTLLAVLVLFLNGGEGIASFTYALLCGLIVGTYSSIGVAAPLVFQRRPPTRPTTLDAPTKTSAPSPASI